MGWIAFVVTGLIYLATSWLIKNYPDTIAGYNTMPEWKKRKTDITGIQRVAGQAMQFTGWAIIIFPTVLFLLGFLKIAGITTSVLALGGPLYAGIATYKYFPKRRRKNPRT